MREERDELHVELCAKSAELGESNAKVKDLTDMSVKAIMDGIDKQAQAQLATLRRERDALLGERDQLVMERDAFHEERDELRADKERLDWLEGEISREQGVLMVPQKTVSLFRRNEPITRAAIDAALNHKSP